MRSDATTAPDVLADRRRTPELQVTTSLQHELAQSQAMCRRHEMRIQALTNAVSVLRRGAAALTDENKELRAELAGRRRGR